MAYWSRALLLLVLPLGAASAHEPRAQDPTAVPQNPTAPSPTDASLLTFGESDARLTVPVVVGAQGPYNFIIDTGAERTVVSRELAGSLKLEAGTPVTVTSMTGSNTVDTVVVPELAIKSIGDRSTIMAPAFEARNLGASGLLGLDTLQANMVSIDFETGQMSVHKSVRRNRLLPHAQDEIVVTAKSLFGQLIVTDAYFGSTRIQVVLDTGSAVTVGNSALRARLGRMHDVKPVTVTSVTGNQLIADYAMVSDVRVGDVGFDSLPIAFSDVPPFKRLGLDKKPALLLGMDALRSFRRVDIDFSNRQVRFLMPRGASYVAKDPSTIRF